MARSTPAFAISSVSLAISAMSVGLGATQASELSSALCIARTRSGTSPPGFGYTPRSQGSVTGPMSISTSPTTAAKREAHSIASSIDFTFISAKPAGSSFDPVSGPLVTWHRPSVNFRRTRVELGLSPSPARNTPACIISSISFPIPAITSWLGEGPPRSSRRPCASP